MDEKLMDAARLYRNLSILWRYSPHHSINFDPHDTGLDAKVLGLGLMKMQ